MSNFSLSSSRFPYWAENVFWMLTFTLSFSLSISKIVGRPCFKKFDLFVVGFFDGLGSFSCVLSIFSPVS